MIPANVARSVTSLGEVLIHIKTIVILCGHEPSGLWCKAWARSAVGDGRGFGIPSSHVFVQQFLDACHKPQTQPHVTPGKQTVMEDFENHECLFFEKGQQMELFFYILTIKQIYKSSYHLLLYTFCTGTYWRQTTHTSI